MNPEFLQSSEQLKFAMQKQIAILREILTNLQQEENLLCCRMTDNLQSLYHSRELLHTELKGVKKERLHHEKYLGKQNFIAEFEISTLRQQIETLTKKMRLQKESNVKLVLHNETRSKAEKLGFTPAIKKKVRIELATEIEE